MMRSVGGIFYFFNGADGILSVVVLLLVSFGLVTIYGIESAQDLTGHSLFYKQLIFSFFGIGIAFFFTRIHYKFLSSYYWHLYVASIVFLILVLIFGESVRGTRGWFQLFGFGIQPVEFAKFSMIVWLAAFFTRQARNLDLFRNVVISGLIVGVVVALVLVQPDFGSALTIVGIWFLMLLSIGIKRKHLLMIGGLVLIVCCVAWFFFFQEYQKERIMVFIDPARDPLGRGYNITQAAIAVGSGGLLGRGLGYGSQTQLQFLPESKTDFIFSVIGEEFGFFGIALLVVLWAVLFWRLIVIMRSARGDFGSFLVLGVVLLFFIQIMVNAGMNIGLAPVTGISLPFISYGGSFLIMSFFMIGLIQSVAVRK